MAEVIITKEFTGKDHFTEEVSYTLITGRVMKDGARESAWAQEMPRAEAKT